MNRTALVRLVLAAAFSCPACVTWAQQALEIIPLRHRTAEQVLAALQPLLEPGATLSGSRGQLFLRASAANAADIKRALEAIDRPWRRLQISVRLDDALESERREIRASGTISNRGATASLTAEEARHAAAGRVDQRLQVLEGGHAFIFPGFEVTPRVSGDQVHLDIAQQREAGMQSQRLSSSVTARLGEWVELGGTARRVWLKVDEVLN
jgi:hypothetical protein